jgi:D-serine deaminase-like pyridoxal phosphate-dependent protein
MRAPPVRVGDSTADIDTPALVVDLDAFGQPGLMANALRGAAVALRPHGKGAQVSDIAFAQISPR